MPHDVVEIFGGGVSQVEVVTTEDNIVEVVVPGPAGAQGIDGVTPVSMAEFDGGNAFVVQDAPFPTLDLGKAE
jgi:hypothetical protein